MTDDERVAALQAKCETVPIDITYEDGQFVVRWAFGGAGRPLATGRYDVIAAYVAGFGRAWSEHNQR